MFLSPSSNIMKLGKKWEIQPVLLAWQAFRGQVFNNLSGLRYVSYAILLEIIVLVQYYALFRVKLYSQETWMFKEKKKKKNKKSVEGGGGGVVLPPPCVIFYAQKN